MKPSTLIVIVLAMIFLLWKGCYHPKFPEIADTYLHSYTSSDENQVMPKPCEGRDKCVYIYLAAWCPHCHDLIANIQDYRNFWKEKNRPGLIVIVGNDKEFALEEMAKNVGLPVFLDPEDKFLKQFHINFFPYFMVVDAHGKIIATKTDAMSWVDREINTHLNKS